MGSDHVRSCGLDGCVHCTGVTGAAMWCQPAPRTHGETDLDANRRYGPSGSGALRGVRVECAEEDCHGGTSTVTDSRRLAGVVGPTLLAVGASEAVNYRIFAANTAPLIYLNGMVLFTAGLSIVRVHNRWVRGWPVVLTVAGWILAVVGLFRMFFPESQRKGENPRLTVVTGSLTAAAGLFLSCMAYCPPSRPREP